MQTPEPLEKSAPDSLDDIVTQLMQPTPNSGCMITACRDLLLAYGIQPGPLEVFDNDRDLKVAKTVSLFAQRIALNQFWTLQLMPFGALTHSLRFKLIDTGTIEHWLAFFKEGPVQFIVTNSLPIAYV